MRHLAAGPKVEALEARLLLDGGTPAVELFGASPAVFAENQGQWADESVHYAFQRGGAGVAFTDDGLAIRLAVPVETGDATPEGGLPEDLPPTEYQTAALAVRFEGAGAVTPAGLDLQETVFNYFVGDQADWRAGVATYAGIGYAGLYDGVDLEVSGDAAFLKYAFHVAPGADWQQIGVTYDGAAGPLEITAAGDLVIHTAAGDLIDRAPVAWQDIGGQRVAVAVTYQLLDADTVGFAVSGAYDPSAELILDPDLAWSTYLGGSNYDDGFGIAVDASGNALVSGTTVSSDFAGRNNSYKGGGTDAFVAKVSSAGSLQWATYLGGSGNDRGLGIAVESSGNAFVTGNTASSDFAGKNNIYKGGSEDAFVAKVSSGGSLQWATYLGGSNWDSGYSLAMDSSGSALVTGDTGSSDFSGRNNSYKGNSDGFVAKVSSGGSLLWATYLGGSADDYGRGVAVDSSGSALVSGDTWSSDFAGRNNSYKGNSDAFGAKVSSSGSLLWSTYLGGGGYDDGWNIAADSSGSTFVSGRTVSSDFAGRNNSYKGGGTDAFVAKVSSAGSLLWATYLGGSGDDYGYGIAVDPSGNAFVTGSTDSSDFVGRNNSYNGNTDAFVVMVTSMGSSLWATYLGGSSYDVGWDIAVGSDGNALVSGFTTSSNLPGRNNTSKGDYDAFVAKITESATGITTIPGALATAWAPGYDAKDFADSAWGNQGGVVLGGTYWGLGASKPTYRFTLPKPSITPGIRELSSITVTIYGKSNYWDSADVLIDNQLQPMALSLSEGANVYAFSGAAARSLLQDAGDGCTSYLDVTIDAVDIMHWYDLRDVTVQYTYEGLDSDQLARLEQVVRGRSAILGFKNFHDRFWAGQGVFNAVAKGIAAEGINMVLSSVTGSIPGTWGPLIGALIDHAYGTYVAPHLPEVFYYDPLQGPLNTTMFFGDGQSGYKEGYVSSALATAADKLRDLGNLYVSSLGDGSLFDNASQLNSAIAEASGAIGNIWQGGQMANLLWYMDLDYSNFPSQSAGQLIEAYLDALSPLLHYGLVPGSLGGGTLDQASSYLVEYETVLAGQALNAAPTDITLSNSSVAENQPSGTQVGTFSAVDPNVGDSWSYALVSGTGSTDNASFTIVGNVLETQTQASFDYEAKNSYSIRVRSTDHGGLYTEKQFTISVTNVNETPTDIALSGSSVAENQPSGTAVGNLSTTDPDSGNTFTYSLVSGTGSTDNASFTINGSALQTAAAFNFEAKSSYSVRLRTTDQGGLWYEKVFTINVTNVNEAPILDTGIPPALTPILAGVTNPAGDTVLALIGNSITDPDGPTALKGIAVTAVDNSHGTWQYSSNNSPWFAFGNPSVSSARQLAANANTKIRFVPDTGFVGTATIQYRAWDQTAGSAGDGANTSTNGGTSAFSTAIVTGTVTVGTPPSENWAGTLNNHWENAGNWSAGIVPGADTAAIFDAPAANGPVLYQDQYVKGIDIRSAGWTINVGGNTLRVGNGGLSIAGGGSPTSRVDLGTGNLIVDYADGAANPAAQIRDWVKAGYNAPAADWNGNGITSSVAASDASLLTAVGVIDNTDPLVGGRTTFEGQAVDASSVLVRYTYWGDANLDGVVNFDDYDVIDYYYWFPLPTAQMGWWTGDLDMDGNVDFDDYDKIDYAYWFQGAPLGGLDAASLEPVLARLDGELPPPAANLAVTPDVLAAADETLALDAVLVAAALPAAGPVDRATAPALAAWDTWPEDSPAAGVLALASPLSLGAAVHSARTLAAPNLTPPSPVPDILAGLETPVLMAL